MAKNGKANAKTKDKPVSKQKIAVEVKSAEKMLSAIAKMLKLQTTTTVTTDPKGGSHPEIRFDYSETSANTQRFFRQLLSDDIRKRLDETEVGEEFSYYFSEPGEYDYSQEIFDKLPKLPFGSRYTFIEAVGITIKLIGIDTDANGKYVYRVKPMVTEALKEAYDQM